MYEFLKEIASIWRLHPGQRQFLLAKAPYRALSCGRRWGKTDACAVEVARNLRKDSGLKSNLNAFSKRLPETAFKPFL